MPRAWFKVAAFVFTVAAVTKSLQPGWAITESANGRNRMDCSILSTAGTGRPALDDELVLTEGGVRIFGGLLDRPAEAGFGGVGAASAIILSLSASDFNIYASRIHLTANIPAGTMKAALTVVASALSAQGVSLDAAQVTGPSLPALSYVDRPILDVLNEIVALSSGTGSTSYVWEIDYNKVLRGFLSGSVAAPFNVTDGDGNVEGDIAVEQPRQSDYANYIVLLGGIGVRDVTDAFVGNGAAVTFALNYTLSASYGYVTVGGVFETLGSGATWSYNAGTNSITRTSAPGVGVAISMTYTAQFPKSVTADGGATLANRVQKTYTAEQVFDLTVMQALANAYLARDMASPKTVRYGAAFTKTGLHPGQTQTIASTKRNLSGSHLITDVQIVHVGGSLVQRRVTAVSALRLPSTLRESFQQAFSGSSSAASGAVGIVTVSGVGGTGTAAKLPKWGSSTSLTDSLVAESAGLLTVSAALRAGNASPSSVAQAADGIVIVGASPVLDTYESGGGVDAKRWRLLGSGGSLFFQTVNDAYSVAVAQLSVDRSGNVGVTTGLALGAATPATATKTYMQAGGAVISEAALIGQGVATGVTHKWDIPTTVAGPHFGAVFQITGAPSGAASYKVAVYGAAQTAAGADDVYGGNFVVQRNAGGTDSNVIGLEININNNKADVALNSTPLVIGMNITAGGTKTMRSAMYVNAGGPGKFHKGLEFVSGCVTDTGIEIGGPTSGYTGTAVLRQLVNNGDTLLLQRFTDAAPTGYLLRARDAADSANLCYITIGGVAQFSQMNVGSSGAAFGGGNGLLIGATTPLLDFYESGAGANLKRFRIIETSGLMIWQTVDDAYTAATEMLRLDRTGRLTAAGGLTFTGSEVYAGVAQITPTTLAANTNNWNPTGLSGARVIWASSSASFQVTGIVAQTNGTRLTIVNIGGFDIVLVPGSASSSAANRIITPGNVNLTLNLGDGIDLIYDGSLWRCVGF